MRRIQLALSVCAVVLVAALSPASAQLTVLQPGFNVKTLPAGFGSQQIECSPGGVWGNYVYVAETFGEISRIDAADNVSPFATGMVTPAGLEFGPGPAGNFGDYLYVGEYFGGKISRVDPSGVVSPFGIAFIPGGVRFDPSGTYGTDLFVVSYAFVGPIVTLPPAGAPATTFSSEASTYMKFGPGGAWGSGMYSSSSSNIVKIDASGASTLFATGFSKTQGFDWAFGGDLFVVDASANQIYRVDSNGAKTLWATLPGAADAAYCNGALYVVSALGGRYKVSAGVASYCTAGTSANGCQVSLSATGTASATASSGFVVLASGVEGNKDGLYFYGTSGRQANPWGNGTSQKCVVPPVKRGGLLSSVGTNGACDGSFNQDLNAKWQAQPAHNPGAGAVVQVQLWYRDPFNTSNRTTSLSDAIEFPVAP